MKIVEASEVDGHITAKVQFPDGLEQSVILPTWASMENIKDEARRLRDLAESREAARTLRPDLEDSP